MLYRGQTTSHLTKQTNVCFNRLMHKSVFLQRIAQRNRKPQITKTIYTQVLNELLTGIKQELAAGREVRFLGFGTFYTRIHKGGKGLNFKTKKPVMYKAFRIAAFRPGSRLKQVVRGAQTPHGKTKKHVRKK